MPPKQSIYFLSTFPPRECGIASFTKDLVDAVKKIYPDAIVKVIAMEKKRHRNNYSPDVVAVIVEDNVLDYKKAAELVNSDDSAMVVNIQHEFGIFGGSYGSNLIHFLEELEKPVVTTFHSVIPFNGNIVKERLAVVRAIAERSDVIVTISGYGKTILSEEYGINESIVAVIPHGIHDCGCLSRDEAKERIGLSGKKIISTFGLISPGKGIEYVLEALPSVVEKNPDAIYLVIGKTHPVVKKNFGEIYRKSLKAIIKEKKLGKHVLFYNEFFKIADLLVFLRATDVYVTSYLDPSQISSGALSYAFGCGVACISTPYLHAKDLLRDGRGVLVGFRNQQEMSDAINNLLGNDSLREELGEKAYSYSRTWLWEKVAESYMHSFKEAEGIKGEK